TTVAPTTTTTVAPTTTTTVAPTTTTTVAPTTTTTEAVYHLVLEPAQPADLKNGCIRTFTATIKDAQENTVDDAATITFLNTQTINRITFVGGPNATPVNGVATKQITANANGAVAIQATADGIISSNTATFNITSSPSADCPSAAVVALPPPRSPGGFGDAPFGISIGALLGILGLFAVAIRRPSRAAGMGWATTFLGH
ncbi:MAG: hypothetical protein WD184_10260, partial [Acidimicrobiia bacterium]